MAVVRSDGALRALARDWAPGVTYGSLRFYDQFSYDYATLYRTQPNVRTCVDFLARNIAQLGLHLFRRVSETDRERVRDHPLALLLKQPLTAEYKVTTYRLIEGLMSDLGVYFNAYLWKVGGVPATSLFRLPPPQMRAKGGLAVSGYELSLGGSTVELRSEDVVHVRGYNPSGMTDGLSPLETLRRVLAEEHAMGEYREGFWANSARMQGIIERPVDAGDWSTTARERFKAEFEALYSGTANSGKTAILEEGMTWKEASFNAQESEYLAGRKLTREECARAYHIPLPMVGILDHATYSNVREQHKHLYQDCLGPWLAMLEQEFELQLLADYPDSEDLYVEFNIAEKLQGSFEEQVTSLQSAVGRPWMTANEARARMNLPSMDEADTLVTPLNVLMGGQASPRDSVPKALEASIKACGHDHGEFVLKQADVDASLLPMRERHQLRWAQYLARYFTRQRNSLIGRVAPLAIIDDVWLDAARWDGELAADLYRLNTMTARTWAGQVTSMLDIEFDDSFLGDYLAKNAQVAAESINRATREQVAEVLGREDPKAEVNAVYERAVEVRAPEIAETHVTNASNFGAQEGARQGGLKGKRWKVNSSNPRDDHAAMNGETVGIRDVFSNGLRWPGDALGGAEETVHCQCTMEFLRDWPAGN